MTSLLAHGRAATTLAVVGFVVAAAACSSSVVGSSSSRACRSEECLPGNKCLPLDGETRCRKVCSSNWDAASSCPFGYTCVAPEKGGEAFCVQDSARIQRSALGLWGAPCNAQKGIDNPDCDGAQGFYCLGVSPTDGAAYCTRYDCQTDRDCGAGFECTAVNTAPNVETTKRFVGDTQKVCVKREFCSTCRVDLDCPPLNGQPQHCIDDDSGRFYCMPECTSSRNCPNQAGCADVGFEYKVCFPRAGVCVGDGSLCSPCRSDADCPDGACVKGEYTTEKTCATRAPQSCEEGTTRGGCPESLEDPNVVVACVGGRINEVPPNLCHGFYRFGSSFDVGCWTPPSE